MGVNMKNLSRIIGLFSLASSLFLSFSALAVTFSFTTGNIMYTRKVDVYLASSTANCKQAFADEGNINITNPPYSHLFLTVPSFSKEPVNNTFDDFYSNTVVCIRLTMTNNNAPEYYGPITLGDAIYSFQKQDSSNGPYSLDGKTVFFEYYNDFARFDDGNGVKYYNVR